MQHPPNQEPFPQTLTTFKLIKPRENFYDNNLITIKYGINMEAVSE